jgi:hypothetical protein
VTVPNNTFGYYPIVMTPPPMPATSGATAIATGTLPKSVAMQTTVKLDTALSSMAPKLNGIVLMTPRPDLIPVVVLSVTCEAMVIVVNKGNAGVPTWAYADGRPFVEVDDSSAVFKDRAGLLMGSPIKKYYSLQQLDPQHLLTTSDRSASILTGISAVSVSPVVAARVNPYQPFAETNTLNNSTSAKLACPKPAVVTSVSIPSVTLTIGGAASSSVTLLGDFGAFVTGSVVTASGAPANWLGPGVVSRSSTSFVLVFQAQNFPNLGTAPGDYQLRLCTGPPAPCVLVPTTTFVIHVKAGS